MTTAPPTPPVDQPTGDQPFPPPSGPSARPELRRSGTDTMLGGVCGGLAEYSGIDPLLWRAGFVLLTLAGGSGVLVYLLLWVFMPPAPLAPGRRPRPFDELVERLHRAVTSSRRPPARG